MDLLKRYSGPGVSFVLGLALQIGGYENRAVSYVLFLIAALWLAIVGWSWIRRIPAITLSAMAAIPRVRVYVKPASSELGDQSQWTNKDRRAFIKGLLKRLTRGGRPTPN